MNLLLALSFLATGTSALPSKPLGHPKTNILNPRLDPNVAVGKPIPDLQVNTYPGMDCKHKGNWHYNLQYNVSVPYQTRSYWLSRDLGPDEQLIMLAAAGWNPTAPNPIDDGMNGLMEGCAQEVATMLPSFTTYGCHHVFSNVGCFKIVI